MIILHNIINIKQDKRNQKRDSKMLSPPFFFSTVEILRTNTVIPLFLKIFKKVLLYREVIKCIKCT